MWRLAFLEFFYLYSVIVAGKARPFLNNLSLPSFFPQRVVMVKTNERLGVQIVNISEFLWVPFGPTFRIWKLLSSKGLDLSGTITLEEPSTPRDFKPQVSKIHFFSRINWWVDVLTSFNICCLSSSWAEYPLTSQSGKRRHAFYKGASLGSQV